MNIATTRIQDATQFGRVAVVMGGQSAEREVSLNSGRNVLDALRAKGIDAHAVDGIPALLDALRAGHYARVFNILHGGGGENGELQGALQALRVPYTGSGVLGSALAMDKVRAKQVWLSLGLPTPRFVALRQKNPHQPSAACPASGGSDGQDMQVAAREIGFPLIVKPAWEGSSVGVTRVLEAKDLDAAVELARRYPGDLLMETLIEGGEYTVGVLDGQALPTIRIVPKGEYYDYNAKYIAEDTEYLCPGLDGAAEEEMRALALAAFDALACSGWGRVDIMRDRQGRNYLLEANTAPGMTSHSLVPKAARELGMDFETLCWRVLETSLSRDSGLEIGGSERANDPDRSFDESRTPNSESRRQPRGAP